jgi:NADH:ubiquinone oxidoreductase subunit C
VAILVVLIQLHKVKVNRVKDRVKDKVSKVKDKVSKVKDKVSKVKVKVSKDKVIVVLKGLHSEVRKLMSVVAVDKVEHLTA